jgi:hypothetical protein
LDLNTPLGEFNDVVAELNSIKWNGMMDTDPDLPPNQWILMDVFIGTTLHGVLFSFKTHCLNAPSPDREHHRLTNDSSDQRQKKKRKKT